MLQFLDLRERGERLEATRLETDPTVAPPGNPVNVARPSWTTTYPGPRPQQGSHAAYALAFN